MVSEDKRRFLAIMMVAAIVLMVGSPVLFVDAYDVPRDLNVGPYVDKVVYKVIEDQITAILSGEVDLIQSFVNPSDAAMLNQDPDISLSRILRMGYGHITINCGKYPFNISAFRRAFAYAFDKTRVTADVMEGNSQEHDSMLPYPMSLCIEDELPYHYYSAREDIGNQILEEANFTIHPGTGYRLAPDGTEFQVVFEYFSVGLHIGITQVAMDAFSALHIDAVTRPSDFSDVMSRLDNHDDYDMVMYATNFVSNEVDWLAGEFGSESADEFFMNPTNFRNETFDSWCDQLLHSTSYENISEAVAAMQLILHENVPRIITYQNVYIQPYRTDKFTGHVSDKGRYIASQWTLRKIQNIDGTRGGTVAITNPDPETFNVFLYGTIYASEVLLNLWPSLFSRDPNMEPWPYLATNLLIETHSDNTHVTNGHTRFTMDIVQNATWSDGLPLTAEDVANTFTYLVESARYGNLRSGGLGNLAAAFAPTSTRVVLEFTTESYWHFSNFAYTKIIPKHIFNEDDGIRFEEWNQWNPVYDPTHPYVAAGPFTLTDWVIGEFYELTVNPDFCYYPDFSEPTTTPTPSTTPTPQGPDLMLALSAGAIGAGAVIFGGGFIMFRKE